MGINRWREWDCSSPRPVAIFHLGGSRTERELRVDRNAIAHMEDLEGLVPTRELQSVFIGSSRTKKHLFQRTSSMDGRLISGEMHLFIREIMVARMVGSMSRRRPSWLFKLICMNQQSFRYSSEDNRWILSGSGPQMPKDTRLRTRKLFSLVKVVMNESREKLSDSV
ncbi:hypothetical protein SDJN02_25059, partial [Cucurbita argyrosperma subsp. argyrosperma]